jgi:hypothetical protein
MSSTYEPIATTTLGSAQSTVTFSSIPATYTDIIAVINGKTTGPVSVDMRLNNDTSTNYSFTRIVGNGSSASSSRGSSDTKMQINSGSSDTEREIIIMQLLNYSNSTTFKTALVRANNAGQSTSAFAGLYRSTSVINRIDFLATGTTFVVGSTFTLYGIKAE